MKSLNIKVKESVRVAENVGKILKKYFNKLVKVFKRILNRVNISKELTASPISRPRPPTKKMKFNKRKRLR